MHIQASVRITSVSNNNIKDVLSFQPSRYVAIFERFLRQGDVGYYAYLDGKCCHRSWLQKGPQWVSINPFIQMKLEKNEGYIHYCETAPWARGKGIYPAVLSRIAEDHENLCNLFICVNSENKASLRGVEKVGFKERERIDLRIILRIPFYHVSVLSPFCRVPCRSYRVFWPFIIRLLGTCKGKLVKKVFRKKGNENA
jgi:RimJ/RimL family protein N-acetyltransferase